MAAQSENQSLVPWSSVDVGNLNAFLSTDTGRKLLPKVAESAPPLLEVGETNVILIRNGKFKGFQEALNEFFLLAHPLPPSRVSEDPMYPNLTNDAAWQDGQKLDLAKPV